MQGPNAFKFKEILQKTAFSLVNPKSNPVAFEKAQPYELHFP
jgi:hypothetical protein